MAEEEEKPKEKRFTKEFVEKWSKTSEEEATPEEAILEKQRKLLEKDPKNEKVWYAQGLLLMDMGRNAEALDSIDRVVSLNPDFPGLWNARAEVLRRLGRQDEAAESLKRALEHVGPHVDVKFKEKMGEPEGVERLLEEVKKEPSPAEKPPEEEELPAEEEVTGVLEELETLGMDEERAEEMSPEEREYRLKISAWEAQGLDVKPLKNVLDKEPYKARTVFFQFEQNLAKINVLKETLDGIKAEEFKDEVERLRQAMKSPMNIWKVEADMGRLLPLVEQGAVEAQRKQVEKEVRAREAKAAAETAPPEKPAKRRGAAPKVTKPPGLKAVEGKVNGLVAGGKVNGLAAGGRVNGLAAGGRVKGLAAGGRVNGLVNGLRAARRGLTNGLTNGNGFTNGLGSNRFRRETMYRRWKLGLVPAIAAILILVSLFGAPTGPITGPLGGITVDGNPSDWTGIPGYTQTQDVPQDNVNVTGYRLLLKDNVLSILIDVKGTALGDPTGFDSFYAFIDSDGSKITGYRLRDIGADFMIETTGGQGIVNISKLSTFIDSNPGGNDNWTAWSGVVSTRSAASGSTLEMQVEVAWLSSARVKFDQNAFEVVVVSDDEEGVGSTTVAKMSSNYGALIVRQEGGPAVVDIGASETILTVTFEAIGSTVYVGQLQFAKSAKVVLETSPSDFDVTVGSPETRDIKIDTRGTTAGDFLTLEVSGVEADRPVTIVGESARAYVSSIPAVAGRRIDGLFQDWPPSEFKTDTEVVSPNNLDIVQYATNRTTTDAFFYVGVRGMMMAGTPVVQMRMPTIPYQGAPAPAQPPMAKRGEDVMRVYIDSDSQDGYGMPALGLAGADYMVEVRGINGKIASKRQYHWSTGIWQLQTATPSAEKDLRRMEIGISLTGVTVNTMQAAFESSSWRRVVDTTQVTSVRSRTRSADETYYDAMYEVRLPNEISAEKTVRFSAESHFLEWSLPASVTLLRGEELSVLSYLSPSILVAGSESVHYMDAYPDIDTDILYEIRETSLKEQFVVNAPIESLAGLADGSVRFTFSMKVDPDLLVYVNGSGPQDLVATNERITFSEGKRELFALPAPFVSDSMGKRMDVSYLWDRSGPTLTIEVPVRCFSMLSYPIIIDPWVNYTIRNTGPLGGGSEQFGYSVAVGDFNGDNYADLLVGAQANSANSSAANGAAYVYLGPLTSNKTTPDVNLPGTGRNYRKGWAVATGKLNNDAYYDLVVTQMATGSRLMTQIFYGRGTWPLWVTQPDVTLNNTQALNTARFGSSVAVGNVDGNFYDDVIIGAILNNSPVGGAAYLYLSPFSSTVTLPNSTLLPPGNNSGQFGYSIAIGPVDSDAKHDVVVGEPAYATPAIGTGRVSYFKGSSLSNPGYYHMPDVTLNARKSGEQFGRGLAIGKLNSDSYQDVAIGAPLNGISTSNGKVYLYLATSSGITSGQTPSAEVTNQSSGENFGTSVLIGSVTGTSTYDLVVGAPLSGAGGTNLGRVYVFDSPLTSSVPTKTQSGDAPNERLGESLAGGGFSNDDHYRIAIGNPRWYAGGNTGRVVMMYVPEFSDVGFIAMSVVCIGFIFGLRRRKRE